MKWLLVLVPGICLAGGADESLDPRNGCFERINADHVTAEASADYINHRAKYRKMVGADRFMSMKQCWENKAKCIKVATECYRDGKIVYEGHDWLWRMK